MKVVCIDDKWFIIGNGPFGTRPPIYPIKDKMYIVVGEERWLGRPFYILEEFPGKSWDSRQFRPVDDSFGDEVERMIKESIREEELIEATWNR